VLERAPQQAFPAGEKIGAEVVGGDHYHDPGRVPDLHHLRCDQNVFWYVGPEPAVLTDVEVQTLVSQRPLQDRAHGPPVRYFDRLYMGVAKNYTGGGACKVRVAGKASPRHGKMAGGDHLGESPNLPHAGVH
jgi:hypothetical protein